MAIIQELLRAEADGTISFGDPTLVAKAKLEDFRHAGDLLKVKTCQELTKLEKNGLFLYESVPGTGVRGFLETAEGIVFAVEGCGNTQLTVGLTDDTAYEVFVDGQSAGTMSTGLGGKLSLSLELEKGREVAVRISQT